MSKEREFYIYKGTSNFCQDLVLGDDCNTMVKQKPDGFYDIVSTEDTIEGGLHVIEYSYAKKLEEENNRLREALESVYDEYHADNCHSGTWDVEEGTLIEHSKDCTLCKIEKALSGETKEGV